MGCDDSDCVKRWEYDSDCVKIWNYDSDKGYIEDRLDRLYFQFEQHVPYFLVGLTTDHKRTYIAAFSTEDGLKAFVRSCQRKKDGEFKKHSLLDGFMDFDIVRFYAPELPMDPQFFRSPNHE